MNENNERSMKYFMIFALGAAAILPVCGEIYANVSRGFAYALVIAWTLAAGVKFSSLPFRSGMLGITSYVFSSMVLSMIGYVIIHPAVRRWIEDHSDYFELPLIDWVKYWAAAFGLLFAAYLVYFIRLGIRKAAGKLRDNGERAASAIDSAFDDTDGSL
ncbi:MAG: hypothetical protein IJ723_00035 [Ruminococcus sp.]|nr:hypothetical protein [Ruminococcus sp.]